MEKIADIVFWFSLSVILYAYLGHFALAYLVGFFRPKPISKADIEPSVSFIIAAYNEEVVIREKIQNTLQLDYPKEKLEIVVVTDGSSDRTPDVVKEYETKGVRLLHSSERRGKTMALNRVVPLTKGDILFFSDANTHYEPSTLRVMMRNFNDPSVGGVSGRKTIRKEGARQATKGEEGFWSYEALLKTLQTRSGSISTADGEIFSLRRSKFESIPVGIVHDDMYLTLLIVRAGMRVVYESDATSEESASKSFKDEFFLKTRYASAGYQIIGAFRGFLIPPGCYFAWQFLSHKLLRWTAPIFLISLYVSSFFSKNLILKTMFLLQSIFYSSAALGFSLTLCTLPAGPLYFPAYFCMGNAAGLYGLVKVFRGGQTSLWRKAAR